MEDTFDLSQLTGEARLLFEHAVAQTRFGASVFWLRRLAVLVDEQTTLSHWQITREGRYRGIVEIIPELP
jgi:ABC-type antimicrobial peptide transport system permease subunit